MDAKEPKYIDVNNPPTVGYCIPIWLRDEQIHTAIKRQLPRIKPQEARPPTDRVAVVCFGPSLNDTWEQIKGFEYIISCSGSHKFLIERGIVPTWHVEVDPRKHKITLLGPPHPDVTYLIASTCHPDYFDHVLNGGGKVVLWHVFDSAEEGLRVLPHGEWALTGGSSVGLRAMGIARFFGFTDIHIFGMDGCEGASGKHAAAHPSQPDSYSLVTYNGVEYRTTPSMYHCAKETWHELDQMPDVVPTFHGEGLVQAMAKDWRRKKTESPLLPLGIVKPELISAEFCELNARLHRENLAYGVGGGKHAETVAKLAASMKTTSILDYGCGKGYLAKKLPFPIWEYDPAIPEKSMSPRPADLVVCTDVLEHVEPDKLLYVLADLARVVRIAAFLTIHTGPAQKKYADGRNTHLIQKDGDWWRKQLERHFVIHTMKKSGSELYVLAGPKVKAKKLEPAKKKVNA